MIIEVGNYSTEQEDFIVLAGTFSKEDDIETRSVCSFTITGEAPVMERGLPVKITEDNGKIIWTGWVENSRVLRVSKDGVRIQDLQCADNTYLSDKRIVRVHRYEQERAGVIIRDIVDTYLAEEGVIYFEDIIETEATEADWNDYYLMSNLTVDGDDLIMED